MPGALEVAGVELPFVIPQGEMNLRGSYSVVLDEAMQLDVHLPQMQINGVTLRAQGLAQDYVAVPTVVISDTEDRDAGQYRVAGHDRRRRRQG